jgi:uncharacterized repeat protein (TIGR01451 family)
VYEGENSMRRTWFIVPAILIVIASVGIVSAQNEYPLIITKEHDGNPVNPGDQFTYTIHIQNQFGKDFQGGPITDTVPDEVEVVSCSSCCSMEDAPNILWESLCQSPIYAGEELERTITVRLKPEAAGKTFCNYATVNSGMATDFSGSGTNRSADDCITVPSSAPEFPSAFLPGVVLAGLLLTVMFIRRSR